MHQVADQKRDVPPVFPRSFIIGVPYENLDLPVQAGLAPAEIVLVDYVVVYQCPVVVKLDRGLQGQRPLRLILTRCRSRRESYKRRSQALSASQGIRKQMIPEMGLRDQVVQPELPDIAGYGVPPFGEVIHQISVLYRRHVCRHDAVPTACSISSNGIHKPLLKSSRATTIRMISFVPS